MTEMGTKQQRASSNRSHVLPLSETKSLPRSWCIFSWSASQSFGVYVGKCSLARRPWLCLFYSYEHAGYRVQLKIYPGVGTRVGQTYSTNYHTYYAQSQAPASLHRFDNAEHKTLDHGKQCSHHCFPVSAYLLIIACRLVTSPLLHSSSTIHALCIRYAPHVHREFMNVMIDSNAIHS
jgi:hypothetical protein